MNRLKLTSFAFSHERGSEEDREGAMMNPFDLTFLCNWHRRAEALANQYGKMSFSFSV
jgi:hypothetical protein